jgi:formate-dependent nitrite reductase membrane component NrfD
MVLIFLESLILVFYLAAMHGATEASEKSVSALIRGDLKVLFWGGVIVCGIIIPFFLKCIEVFSSEVDLAGLMVISGLFVLLGGLLLRYGVLAAGIQVTPLLPKCR